jgi:hypothetical protein
MRIRIGFAAIGLALCLSACDTLEWDPFGENADVAPNGCTTAGCPQATQYCVNRGYTPGTDRYNRCVLSVEENLRKGN